MLRERGVSADDTQIRGYEYGWTERPDPVVLLELARLYKTDVTTIISVLRTNRQNAKLSDTGVKRVLRETQRLKNEETAASARLAEIREGLHEIGAQLIELSERSTELARKQAPTTRMVETQRSSRNRANR